MRKDIDIRKFLANNIVPIIFIVLCAVCIPLAGYSGQYLVSQIITRIMRNSFLVLSLLIPIMAGMGLNFGMTLGAMAGQIGIIFITAWNVVGIPGLLLAAIIATPIAALLGWFCGKMLNMAKGREMITSYMISFFMNGVYQLVVLYGMGPVIPLHSDQVILPRGYGVRNTIDLISVRQSVDNFWALTIGGVKIPLLTIILIALVISTIFAAYGMILYLSNMGTLNTYNSHSQIGMFSIAALLVGGASVSRASIKNVFLGIILFHLMFILAPQAGRELMGQAQIGEFFRVFISYGVITLSLVLYKIRERREKAESAKAIAAQQKEAKA